MRGVELFAGIDVRRYLLVPLLGEGGAIIAARPRWHRLGDHAGERYLQCGHASKKSRVPPSIIWESIRVVAVAERQLHHGVLRHY
jgi:hypothetical protein